MWSDEYGEAVKVIQRSELWGRHVCRVWVPSEDTVAKVAEEDLQGVEPYDEPSMDRLVYAAAASRILDTMSRDVLLSPLEGNVIPLPHQMHAVSRAISGDRVRYLLADEVGLGKTIEAGMILRELKLRGLVERVLVVVPKGLMLQWVEEMETHFGETFRPVEGSDIATLSDLGWDDNVWHRFDQVVCSQDSVKPIDGRKGWSRERTERYNRQRFEHLISAGWDLIIADEAHRLGGSSDTVARHELGKGLSQAAPYLLLLSATPHQGKTEQFWRLMSLIDPEAFPDVTTIERERVARYVIRTEKRKAVDADGNPLFMPRRTHLVAVEWEEQHRRREQLYEAVTEYVREGYNRALQENKNYIGFLMVLMQRLVSSSTRAIRKTLERRLAAVRERFSRSIGPEEDVLPDWWDPDEVQEFERIVGASLSGLDEEVQELEGLQDRAKRCERTHPDARAEALLDWMYRLQREEANPSLKFLVFTEFVSTQRMLREFLQERGFSVACLNGSMSLRERRKAQEQFRTNAQVLVSTDAGGEGINLQFCHVVINYDLPWNPMRLEQRIGRVDRIGQTQPVRALNFVLKDTVEHRVQEVLQQKLSTILEEYGVDKTEDVLDCSDGEADFQKFYVDAVLDPDAVEERADHLVDQIRSKAEGVTQVRDLATEDEKDYEHAISQIPRSLPFWIETMTESYLAAEGGAMESKGGGYDLRWPDGKVQEGVTFDPSETGKPGMDYVSLHHDRIQSLLENLPQVSPAENVPQIRMDELPGQVQGYWSLWNISLETSDSAEKRLFPVFRHDDGRNLVPTAERIWDLLVEGQHAFDLIGRVEHTHAEEAYCACRQVAQQRGEELFRELEDKHRKQVQRERDKVKYAFRIRGKAIKRVGLPEVRDYRLRKLRENRQEKMRQLNRREKALPGLDPILIARVEGHE